MKYLNTDNYVGKRVASTFFDYTLTFALTFYYIYVVGTPNVRGGHTVSGLPALVPMVFWFLYFIIAEAFMGGTLGHQIFKLKVVSVDKSDPTFGQIILRRISDALEIALCFGLIAFILAKTTPRNQRLGDFWAKTLVTGKDELFVNEQFDFETNLQNNPRI